MVKTLIVGKLSGKTRQLVRDGLFREIRSLAPHEIRCRCGQEGKHNLASHEEGCPRAELHLTLKALEDQ